MKKYVTEKLNINNNEVTLYSINFDNIYEMIDCIENADYVYPWNLAGSLASHIESNEKTSWTGGTKNFEEALELLKYGDNDDIENLFSIKDEISNLMPYLSKNRTVEYSPYGTRPNVARFLTQNPNCMYKLKREELNNVVNIYYNVSSKYGTDIASIKRRGMLTLSLTDVLEKLDYRVNLVFFDLNKLEQEYILIKLNIKDGLQTLDPSICFFPLCHPAYNRRITPSIMEKCKVNKEEWYRNYGNPCNDEEEIRQIFNISDNDICITDSIKLGENSLVEDIITFFNKIDFNRFLEKTQEFVFNEKENKFEVREKQFIKEEIKNNISTNESENVFKRIKKIGSRNKNF